MLPPDNIEAARTQSLHVQDPRLTQFWDGERTAADLFAQTLALRCPAWDVYLVYEPGATWTDALPPEPAFWMHQLPVETGAPPGLRLNAARLTSELARLLG